MRRITRDRRLTPEEATKYRAVREQVEAELPDLIARHHERQAALDELEAARQMFQDGLLAQQGSKSGILLLHAERHLPDGRSRPIEVE